MTARQPRSVRVVGTGLVGTSVGLALCSQGVDVTLFDPSPSAVALARDLGAGRIEPNAAADLVVVAAPPDVVADVVAAELAARPDAVVTDVASVKSLPLKRLRAMGVDVSRYVGGHPLAGRERSGAVAARADLFAGRPWVLTPTEETSEPALQMVRWMAGTLGATVSVMDAVEHDEAVAVISHVPQVAASLVAARLRSAPESAVALAGQGVRDVTRIAASDPHLWTQILAGNAGAVARALHALRDDLDSVLAAVDALGAQPDDALGARATVAGLVAAGNEGHARIPGKHGSAPTVYVAVPVIVPDRPGELARLLRDVGDAGVNLEDLRIEHSEGRPMGLAEIDVLPAAAQTLVGALRERGWTVHA
ncbi:prephenate dehydrogenase [Angustibacter sp. McL0619]|uniref:prephenate dehydrogenase n=1 Tax=Angustibacter sp. McL0619 TaxID=3415676 RepID=UPI003CF50294